MYIYDIECMLIHWNQNGYKGTIFWFLVFLKNYTPPPTPQKNASNVNIWNGVKAICI